jgi:transposase
VAEYLKTSKIQLHFLPPYSPHLNPIERLWKWMKERVIYNTYYPEFEDFRLAVFGFFAVLSTLTAESVLDLLRNSDSVDFRVLLSQFSIQLAGTIYEC